MQRRRRRSSTDSPPPGELSPAPVGPLAETIALVLEGETGPATLELIQTASPLRDHWEPSIFVVVWSSRPAFSSTLYTSQTPVTLYFLIWRSVYAFTADPVKALHFAILV